MAKKEERAMNPNKLPSGWDEDALAPEAGVEPSETVMSVPHDLGAIVRELIAKRQR
jgi:hypothetical protein